MGKLGGGIALLAVAMLMVVGFLRTGADPFAPVRLIALAIAAGLPAAGGSWLLARYFRTRRGIESRREQLRRPRRPRSS